MILQAGVFGDKIAMRTLGDQRLRGVIPEVFQPGRDFRPRRDFIEVGAGQRVLRVGPFLDLGAVGILQPAVGIGHRRAEYRIDHAVGAGDRVVGSA